MGLAGQVCATTAERAAAMPGDDIVAGDAAVIDRAFDLDAAPEVVWPWLLQLGKGRAGWYLPRGIEKMLPHKASRHVEPRWQQLRVHDVVPDYGPDGSFTVVSIDPPHSLVYDSQRGRRHLSWSIALFRTSTGSRIRLRVRLAPVRHRWLVRIGDGFDAVTIAGMAAGLRERLGDQVDAA